MKQIVFVLLTLVSFTSYAQSPKRAYTLADQVDDLYKKSAATTTLAISVTAGSASTLPNGSNPQWVKVNPPATLASYTFTLPPYPIEGQRVSFSFGGNLTSGTVVTTLAINANTGQSIVQGVAPTTATAGQAFEYRYSAAIAKWYRLY